MNSVPKATFWEFLQNLGKTFMLPVALLAFSGILLGIGSSFSGAALLKTLPFLDNIYFQALFTWMTKLGLVTFIYLPVMFAIAIPIGLAREEKGVAAFAGFVSFATLNLTINFYLTMAGVIGNPEEMAAYGVKSILGIESIDTGILGAVFVGVLAAKLHTRFYTIKLPDALAFFGGARFVPIITVIVTGVIGLFVPIIWPWFAAAIQGIGNVISDAGSLGPMLFGSAERLLLPLGLHHILVALVRFSEVGGVMPVDGQQISGALNIFYAQLSSGTEFSVEATRFLSQGKMPAFLGGLPGAALAMYHCSNPENREKIKALLLSGLVACVVGGITEPLEFLFLFIAPLLFVFHAIMTGFGFMVMGLLDVTIGNTDGNIIDFFIFGILQGTQTKWYLVPLVASVWFVAYYAVFRFAIIRFDLKTPGREVNQQAVVEAVSGQAVPADAQAELIMQALGGAKNILSLDNCITRLRLSVMDINLIDEATLKANGALGVVKLDAHNLQVVIGPKVHVVKNQLQSLMPLTS